MNVSGLQAPGVREAEPLMHLVAEQLAQLIGPEATDLVGRNHRKRQIADAVDSIFAASEIL